MQRTGWTLQNCLKSTDVIADFISKGIFPVFYVCILSFASYIVQCTGGVLPSNNSPGFCFRHVGLKLISVGQ